VSQTGRKLRRPLPPVDQAVDALVYLLYPQQQQQAAADAKQLVAHAACTWLGRHKLTSIGYQQRTGDL